MGCEKNTTFREKRESMTHAMTLRSHPPRRDSFMYNQQQSQQVPVPQEEEKKVKNSSSLKYLDESSTIQYNTKMQETEYFILCTAHVRFTMMNFDSTSTIISRPALVFRLKNPYSTSVFFLHHILMKLGFDWIHKSSFAFLKFIDSIDKTNSEWCLTIETQQLIMDELLWTEEKKKRVQQAIATPVMSVLRGAMLVFVPVLFWLLQKTLF